MRRPAPITHSPHADLPLAQLTPKEQHDRYYTRTPESFTPWNVDQVLRKVYHRDYSDDLSTLLQAQRRSFRTEDGALWNVASLVVIRCSLVSTDSVLEQPIDRFFVDQIVDAEIRYNLQDRSLGTKRKTEYRTDRFRLRYGFNFCPEVLSCRPAAVLWGEESSPCGQHPAATRLNEFLLPVMGPEEYERFADVLRFSLLGIPPMEDVSVSADALIEALHLTLREGVFLDESVQGEYFFNHGCERILDPDLGSPTRYPIDPGTVIVSCAIENPALRASTIVHECVHHLLGTPFFLLQKTHGHKYCAYMRKTVSPSRMDTNTVEDVVSPLDILEEQAEILPGYLMIPSIHGRAHAAALMHSYGSGPLEERLRWLIRDMAQYYGTTRGMACRRLVDFGYTEIVDLVRRSRYTWRISEEDALQEFLLNPVFRSLLRQSVYLRVDGYYCRNERLYLVRDRDGTPHLSCYARQRLRECCLPFRRVSDDRARVPGAAVLKTLGHRHVLAEFADCDGRVPLTAEGMAVRDRFERARRDEAELSLGFNAMTVKLMQDRGVTVEQLAERSGLSVSTVKNLRTDPDRVFPIEEIVAFCIALRLPPAVSRRYVERSPSKFLDSTDMQLYEFALLTYYDKPLSWVNRWLIGAGAPPLTSLIDGYDEDGHFLAS